ncbi:hypothetical protein B0H11DRAFT_2262817 [Mycena galericulata]|nr:hypothetical protein B0H11DRAFT_2262817 [Mycena galericulata]
MDDSALKFSYPDSIIRDEDGRFLDPFHHLRRPGFVPLIPYLLDHDKMVNMDDNIAADLLHHAIPPLASHTTEWLDREMPQVVQDLLYPLRLFLKKFTPETIKRAKPITPPSRNPVTPWFRLPANFKMPPPTSFHKPRPKERKSETSTASPTAPATSTSKPATSTKKSKTSTATTPVSGKSGAVKASSSTVAGSSSVSAHPARPHSSKATTSTPAQSKPSKPAKAKPRPSASLPIDVQFFDERPDDSLQLPETIVVKRAPANAESKPSVPVKRKFDGIEISEAGPSNDGPRARRERTVPARELSADYEDHDESPEPAKRPRKASPKGGRKARGPLRSNAPPAKNYTLNIDDIPEKARYLFDDRVITAYLPHRFNHGRGKNKKKVGKAAPDFEPWYPRVKTVTYYDGIAPTEVISTTKSVPEQNRYGPLPPIPRKNIEEVMLRILEDPGFSCIECILFNTWCEFRGYGTQCTACESQNRKGCSYRGSTVDLDRIFIQMAPWFDTGTRHLVYLVAELHAAHVRAHNATVEAVHAVKEFENRWVDFSSQSTRIIGLIGADTFSKRFTSSNSTPSLLDAIAGRVEHYNDLMKEFDERSTEDHVAAYDPNIDAHGGQRTSGSSEGLEKRLPRVQLSVATLVDDPPREQYSPPPDPLAIKTTRWTRMRLPQLRTRARVALPADDDLEGDESDLDDGDDGSEGEDDEESDLEEDADAASFNPDQSDLDDGDDKEYNAQKGVVEG